MRPLFKQIADCKHIYTEMLQTVKQSIVLELWDVPSTDLFILNFVTCKRGGRRGYENMKNCLCEKKLKLRKDNFSGIPTMTITYIYFQKANRWINVDLRLEHAFCRMTRQIEYAGRRLLAHQVLSRREAHSNSIHLSMVLFFSFDRMCQLLSVSSLLLRLDINDFHVELGGIMFRAWVHMDWCYNHNMITCKTSVYSLVHEILSYE